MNPGRPHRLLLATLIGVLAGGFTGSDAAAQPTPEERQVLFLVTAPEQVALLEPLLIELGEGTELSPREVTFEGTTLERIAQAQRIARLENADAALFIHEHEMIAVGPAGLTIRRAPITDTDLRSLAVVGSSVTGELFAPPRVDPTFETAPDLGEQHSPSADPQTDPHEENLRRVGPPRSVPPPEAHETIAPVPPPAAEEEPFFALTFGVALALWDFGKSLGPHLGIDVWVAEAIRFGGHISVGAPLDGSFLATVMLRLTTLTSGWFRLEGGIEVGGTLADVPLSFDFGCPIGFVCSGGISSELRIGFAAMGIVGASVPVMDDFRLGVRGEAGVIGADADNPAFGGLVSLYAEIPF